MSHNGTILIVEDNEMSLIMAKSLLQLAGYDTLEATNADAAIDLVNAHAPDLILMDLHLPVKSGYEATRELKSDPRTVHIPIVAFTALAMQEEQQKAIDNGCIGVISKPIDVKQFSSTVAAFLKQEHSLMADKPTLPSVQENAIDSSDSAACPHCVHAAQLKQDWEEFLFHVSHDLQGPLRKIQQFATFLEMPDDGVEGPVEKEAYYQGIYRSVHEMENLLSGLLKLSRVNRNEDPFVTVALKDVVEAALSRYASEIDACGAQIKIGELVELEADRAQLQIAFDELIGNALKFKTEEGQPYIHIDGSFQGDGCYEIRVEDNGIGLPAAEPDRIFKPFFRFNSVSRYPGYGLGLAVVKKIIERHGGTVTAECRSDGFTVIRMRLPQLSSVRTPLTVIDAS